MYTVKPIIVYVANSETDSNFVTISKEEFRKIVDKAYEAGIDDAKRLKPELTWNSSQPTIRKPLLECKNDG